MSNQVGCDSHQPGKQFSFSNVSWWNVFPTIFKPMLKFNLEGVSGFNSWICFWGVVAPRDENHHEKNTNPGRICLVNTFSKQIQAMLQIDSYQSIGTYLWSIHVSKNPNVIASEIRKDMFSNCLTFFKFSFNMTLLLHGFFYPCRENSTPKIWGICGTSSFSGRRSTRGEPRGRNAAVEFQGSSQCQGPSKKIKPS